MNARAQDLQPGMLRALVHLHGRTIPVASHAATSDIELLTRAAYARLRRCSLRTLDRERSNHSGCPYVRLGGRIFYRRSDIENYIETLVQRYDGAELLGVGRDHD